MPTLSRKERKRKESNTKRVAQEDLPGDIEVQSTEPPSLNDEKPVIEGGIAELNSRACLKEEEINSDIDHAEHHLEGLLEEGEKVVEENDPSEDVAVEAFSQESLEDIFTSTPPVNSEDDDLEITPNPPSKKKVKRTKKHTHECPQNPSRKLMFGMPKKKGKKTSKKTSHKTKRKCDRRKEFQNREIEHQGVWVQCDNFRCRKWRFLSSISDPAKVEQHWICTMHPDDTFNSCDKPEEDYSNLEFIHNKFTEGSIVWAKMQGYPCWPAMIESDPDTGCFMEHEGVETEVTRYHCVFLDKTVSRSWVPAIFVKAFEAHGNPPSSLTLKKRNYTKQVMPAKARALEALSLPLKERIEKYGFGNTYKGVWREANSRENSSQCQDAASHEEEASEIDADDVLGDMLSSEDMEELMNETEGLMAEAEEAVQEMDEEEKILVKASCEETVRAKHGRKRKSSKCHEESKVKRKKHKKKRKHDKSKKVEGTVKKWRKKSGREIAVKDEVITDGRGNIEDDENLSYQREGKGGVVMLNDKKEIESDNEFEELVQKVKFSDRAGTGQRELELGDEEETCNELADEDGNGRMKGEGEETCDEVADEDDNGEIKGGEVEEICDETADEDDNGSIKVKENDNVEMEEGVEDGPVLSKEETDVDRGDCKIDGEPELKEREFHDVEMDAENVKVKKDCKKIKAEREEKRKERELKKQCALEEKERKMKERELKKIQKEKEKQEREEKKKQREIKKQQALEEKERKKKARMEKAEKKAKKMEKSPELSGETHNNSEKLPVKAAGDASDGAELKAKKPKFPVPKGKHKAFVPPGGKPKMAVLTDQHTNARPPHTSPDGDVDKDEGKGGGEGGRAIALNEPSLTKGKESKNKEGNDDKKNASLITNENVVKDSRIAPKLKKKKFSVKRKEPSSESAVKNEHRQGTVQETAMSIPLTTADGPDSKEVKASFEGDSKKENLTLNSMNDVTKNFPNDNPMPVECIGLESRVSNDCGEIGGDTRELEITKSCKVQDINGSQQKEQDHKVNTSDNNDVLDLEWSEAPEMASKKSLIASVIDEDSDPFEAVEE